MSIQNPIRQISVILESRGHQAFGVTRLQNPHSLELYESWIRDGYHGEMEYLKTHLPMKREPQMLLPTARSAIVIAFSYLPHPHSQDLPMAPQTALYAQGADYHHWICTELDTIIQTLQLNFPGAAFLSATDSKPVLERDLAYRAGLGWIGKNTCVIDTRRGSLFVIGEILTSLDLENPLPVQPDRCGTCTRCLDACPTQAFVEPRKLDARKCISFLTIESKTLPPLDLRKQLGQFFFGCDICQTVCPWNLKAHGTALSSRETDRERLVADLQIILTSSGKALERLFHGTPLTRASRFGHIRNAILVAAHHKLLELSPSILSFRKDERLAPLVEWYLKDAEQLAQDPEQKK